MALQECPPSTLQSERQGQPVGYLDFYDNRIDESVQATYSILENEILRIGRDARSNDVAISNDSQSMVSRNHCEVYVIVYDPSTTCHVYVRDRKSINGTYVNEQLAGAGPDISPGFLLDDGDVIDIRPHWKFKFKQDGTILRRELTSVQREECEVFLSKYILTNRCLGEGAEAAVYLAIHPTSGKQLVCKVVDLDNTKGKNKREVRRRKFQETDILRQLQHPNILSYVDAISSPHSLYTFTDLASGGDLWSFIYRHNYNVSELDARIILRQVIRGLQYLHRKGIVHRDLKPENILLAYSPKISCHRVLLSDFGASAVPQRNRMVTVVGTAGYQAPEQMGKQLQTATADMWSLGMVALALLSPMDNSELQDMGHLDQPSLDECIDKIIARRTTPPSKNSLCFVRSCLQISPQRRLTTDDAARHTWLCTPRKHAEFFRKFDEKMIKGFQLQEEFRPIPWEIPGPEDAGQGKLDVANAPSSSDPMVMSATEVNSSGSETSHFFQEKRFPDNSSSPLTPNYSLGLTCNSLYNTAVTTTSIGEQQRVSEGCIDPEVSHGRLPGGMRGIYSPKFSDATIPPLTGSDKHPRKSRQKGRRLRVLEELKTKNSKFLSSEPDGYVPGPVTYQAHETIS